MVSDLQRSCLDAGALDRLAHSIGAGNVVEILDRVLESAGAVRDGLGQLAASGDSLVVAELAHSLKSECAYLGADDLVRRLEQIESEVRTRSAPIEAARIHDVVEALGGFLEDVRRERDARRAGAVREPLT